MFFLKTTEENHIPPPHNSDHFQIKSASFDGAQDFDLPFAYASKRSVGSCGQAYGREFGYCGNNRPWRA